MCEGIREFLDWFLKDRMKLAHKNKFNRGYVLHSPFREIRKKMYR